MDKKVFHQIYIKSLKENFLKGLCFFTETVFGVFCCFLGVYITFSLAKNGSDLFYYAMAFASPGTAIEFLHEPVFEEEPETEVFIPKEEVFEEEPAAEEVFIPDIPEIFEEIPENRKGKITETQYSAKEGGIYVSFGNAVIKNCTKHSAEKINQNSKPLTAFPFPEILRRSFFITPTQRKVLRKTTSVILIKAEPGAAQTRTKT
jgi:hypothetical protein